MTELQKCRLECSLNSGWEYHRGDIDGFPSASSDGGWSLVDLPHNTSLYTAENKAGYKGISCYRRVVDIDESIAGKRAVLTFGGVMQRCEVFLNSQRIAVHLNGNTPFAVDVTSLLRQGGNELCVRCDSRADGNLTPGKETPDFQYFGGIHRNVTLTLTDSVYIGEELLDDTAAGGGVFLTSPYVSAERAEVRANVRVHNDGDESERVRLTVRLCGKDGCAAESAAEAEIPPRGWFDFSELLEVLSPRLWHPYSPELYDAEVSVWRGEELADRRVIRCGIRSVEWTHEGLFINGGRFKAHGTNLHQEIFVLGNAIPDNAVFEEIRKLKESGFDLIRMAHCPHSRAYYEACDRFGVLVVNCMSGWQYFNDCETFVQSTFEELRCMVRTARNHPCIAAWETSLNESNYSVRWAEEIHRIAHEEYPAEGVSRMWTCGWMTDCFDITLGASQAGVREEADSSEKGVIISEYGDWDYGGTFSASRRPRELGDNAMLTACADHIESLILNRGKAWFCADALWSYQDYSGFDKIMTYCGVTDMYRLDKHSAYFYRSQRGADVDMRGCGIDGGAMVYIANKLWEDSPENVTVFSNCDSVELFADGKPLGRQLPDCECCGVNSNGSIPTEALAHPPFTFVGANKGAATLTAVGYLGGEKAVEFTVRRPSEFSVVRLVQQTEAPLAANGSDARLVWAYLTDENGTTVPEDRLLDIAVTNGYVIGYERLYTRGGCVGFWVRASASREDGAMTVTVSAEGASAVLEIAVSGSDEPFLRAGAVNEYSGAVEPAFKRLSLADFDSPTSGSDAAREKPAYASSCADGVEAAYGNDGNPARSWSPAAGDEAPYWYVDMGEVQSISTMEISWNESELHSFVVETSDDAEHWTEVLNYLSDTAEFGTRLALSAAGRYLRLRFGGRTSGFSMFYLYKSE